MQAQRGINTRKSEEEPYQPLASMKFYVILTSLAIAAGATARSLTVHNACPFTIWWVSMYDIGLDQLLTLLDSQASCMCGRALQFSLFNFTCRYIPAPAPALILGQYPAIHR